MTELELLQQIYDLLLVISNSEYLYGIYEMLALLCGFVLFFVVVTLFKYSYKFFNMFF